MPQSTTANDARTAVRAHIAARGLGKGFVAVEYPEVSDGNEGPTGSSLLYPLPHGYPRGYWIMEGARPDWSIDSGIVAVVSKATGAVVYVGPDHSEG